MPSASIRSQTRFLILHFHAFGSAAAAAAAMDARASASRRRRSDSNAMESNEGDPEEGPSVLPELREEKRRRRGRRGGETGRGRRAEGDRMRSGVAGGHVAQWREKGIS